jgi:hypothetical protein
VHPISIRRPPGNANGGIAAGVLVCPRVLGITMG